MGIQLLKRFRDDVMGPHVGMQLLFLTMTDDVGRIEII